jgi:archaellum component FlaC
MENAEAMMDLMQNVADAVQDAFNEVVDTMDNAAKPIERAAEAIDNYVNIVDIVGQDMLGVSDELQERLEQSVIDVAHSATVAAQEKMETIEKSLVNAQRLLDEAIAAGDEAMANKWRDVIQEMND